MPLASASDSPAHTMAICVAWSSTEKSSPKLKIKRCGHATCSGFHVGRCSGGVHLRRNHLVVGVAVTGGPHASQPQSRPRRGQSVVLNHSTDHPGPRAARLVQGVKSSVAAELRRHPCEHGGCVDDHRVRGHSVSMRHREGANHLGKRQYVAASPTGRERVARRGEHSSSAGLGRLDRLMVGRAGPTHEPKERETPS